MRQIHVCAWMMWAVAACGGGEFSTSGGGEPGTTQGAGASSVGAAPNAAGAGESSEDQLGTGPGGGGQATGGSTSVVSGGGRGGTASGGGPSRGGTANAGASPGTPTADDCPDGVITFRMLPSPKLDAGYLCDAGCGTGWLSITDEKGATGLPITSACGTATCEACEVRQCAAAACLATPLTGAGSELTWDGTYLVKDSCGPKQLVCQRRECVKPGRYHARACAAVSAGASLASGGCVPLEERLCKDVEFEFPATKTVQIVLGD